MTTNKASALALALCLSFFAAGCKKKVGVPPPPVAPKATETVKAAPVARPIVKFFTYFVNVAPFARFVLTFAIP